MCSGMSRREDEERSVAKSKEFEADADVDSGFKALLVVRASVADVVEVGDIGAVDLKRLLPACCKIVLVRNT